MVLGWMVDALLALTRFEVAAQQWVPGHARALSVVAARVLMTSCCVWALLLRLAQQPDLESRLVAVPRVVPVETKCTTASIASWNPQEL